MPGNQATALVAAAVVTVMIFPTLAALVLRKPASSLAVKDADA
jgi:hypothetical protein